MIKGSYNINLAYASSIPERPWANFGDSLNPILMHLLTGAEITHTDFDQDVPRLSAIGTILQDFSNGELDVWGTGMDVTYTRNAPWANCFNPSLTGIDYKIHAVRGMITNSVIKAAGIPTNDIYGDPAILLKKMLKTYVGQHKTGKIGVVCHLSELASYDDSGIPKPEIARYHFDSDDIVLISTIVKPEPMAILEKIKEIASCSYILSTSLHGLIIADIFETPCAQISDEDLAHGTYNIYDYRSIVDHRFRDYYSGMRQHSLPIFFAPQSHSMNTSAIKNFLESAWKPLKYLDEIAEELVHALPVRASGYHDHRTFGEYLSKLKL
ncbi:polysaccharide pyruvyl transferase family protein [Pseudomonas putida]|nr:polysaccharide pyruvyl transferase family protein [Pseudomonas putida]